MNRTEQIGPLIETLEYWRKLNNDVDWFYARQRWLFSFFFFFFFSSAVIDHCWPGIVMEKWEC